MLKTHSYHQGGTNIGSISIIQSAPCTADHIIFYPISVRTTPPPVELTNHVIERETPLNYGHSEGHKLLHKRFYISC